MKASRTSAADVRYRRNGGKHLLVLSFSAFDPKQTSGSAGRRPVLDPDQSVASTKFRSCAMASYGWKYVLSVVATLTLAFSAICILLFAM